MRRTVIAIALLILAAMAVQAETLTVVGWNVDSDRRSLGSLEDRFAAAGPVDLWALSGVSERWLDKLARLTAAGSGAGEYAYVRLAAGSSDVVIFYDPRRFVLASHCQLDEVQPSIGGSRVPLVARLRLASGLEILLADAHLYPTSSQIDEGERYQQMERFNHWASVATDPVLAAGDFNAEWRLEAEAGERASPELRALTADGALEWIRPETLVATACDQRYAGVRHHAFAGGPARAWQAHSEILFPGDDYCAAGKGAGHRPVRAVFELP